ncbi:hypothetical protein AX16_009157 [Volvariella volvacea WC 439]|nr:hypothetical protein AX16_009157 [Volvariella volvacea WC 439]
MKLTGLSVLAAAIGSVSAVNFRLYQNNANCDASAPGVVVKNYTNTLHNPCMSPGNNATFSMSLDYVNGPEYYVSLEAFSESEFHELQYRQQDSAPAAGRDLFLQFRADRSSETFGCGSIDERGVIHSYRIYSNPPTDSFGLVIDALCLQISEDMKPSYLAILTACVASASAVKFTLYQNSESCNPSAPGVNVTTVTDTYSAFCQKVPNGNTFSFSLDEVESPFLFCFLKGFPGTSKECLFSEELGGVNQVGACFSSKVPISKISLGCAIP